MVIYDGLGRMKRERMNSASVPSTPPFFPPRGLPSGNPSLSYFIYFGWSHKYPPLSQPFLSLPHPLHKVGQHGPTGPPDLLSMLPLPPLYVSVFNVCFRLSCYCM